MFVKSQHTYTWWSTLGGVGAFTKEKKLELMWINSVKKRVQNFTGGVYRKDRVSQSAPDAGHAVTGCWVLRLVSGSSDDAGVGLRPDAG